MVNDGFLSLGVQFAQALAGRVFSKQPTTPTYDIDLINNAIGDSHQHSTWTGDKFYGGFGITKDYSVVDYWLLRRRSKQLFTENPYACGLIRRLLTNVINKGLNLEATPDASILGLDDDQLSEWSENVERRFVMWGKNPNLCDYKRERTIGAIERQAEMMAMISGDVLVILRQGSSGLPNIELVDAEHVVYPDKGNHLRAVHNRGNTVEHGVEIDKARRHVAFFVKDKDGHIKRVPARGSRTKRRQAWLHYSTERMIDDVRGMSLLALMMQSLKEVDRYRDAEQRSAVVNSTIAMWIEKGEDKMSSLAFGAGATRHDSVTTQNDEHGRKDVEFSRTLPGVVMQELQHGEKPTSYDTKRPNVNFAIFETAIISTVAWSNEIPPEILMLAFHQNYAASRGAVVEFKMYLDRKRTSIGEELLDPIYQDFLVAEVLNGDILAPGFLESTRDATMWATFGAWTSSDWSGAVKPNTDLLKDVKAYGLMIDKGLITKDRATRELNGMKYSKAIRTLKKENEQFVETQQPLIDAGLLADQNAPEVSDSPEVNSQ